MPANRFYTEDDLREGSNATIRAAEHHHLAHVMRVKVGEQVELVNGRGMLATASIINCGRQEAQALIQNASFSDPPKNRVIIVQAMPRPNRLEFILEKCTELGMDELWLFPGERSEKKVVQDSQLKRMKIIIISAMKQSGRVYLPKVIVKEPITNWKETAPGNLFFGDVHPEAPLLMDAWKRKGDGDALFFIGPESGFSEREEHVLKEMGAIGVKLHRNILRTDTASMVVLSVIGMFE
jgi:16S rRNA (uracil1498-N3)-methyltransferase